MFPTPLYYNRFTGTFVELPCYDCDAASLLPPFGATDEERERMILWAKKERLPMFFRHLLIFMIKIICFVTSFS